MKLSCKQPLTLCIILLFSASLFANNSKTANRVALGKQLQKVYPEENFIALNQSTHVHFGIGKKKQSEMDQDGKLQVVITEKKDLIALSDNQSYSDYQVYSLATKIQSIFFSRNKARITPNEMTDNTFENDGIFHSDYRYRQYSINLGPLGEKTNIQSKKIVYDSKYINRVFFHENYSLKNRTIVVDVPKWMEIEIKEFNFGQFDIQKTSEVLSINGKEFTRITFRLNNASKIDHKSYDRPKSFTFPHIIILCKKYSHKGQDVQLIGSTEQLYKWYYSLVMDLEYGNEAYLKKALELTDGVTGEEAKVKTIYYWIQDNIRYIAFENGLAGFRPIEAHEVFENRYGDCKGMANLCKAMLQVVGLKANLTWIGTKSIPYDYSLPSVYVDNHMICSIVLNGTTYFLDATEKNQAIGKNAYRIRGRQVLVENGTNAALIKNIPDEFGQLDSKIVKNNFVVTPSLINGRGEITLHEDEKNNFLFGLAHKKQEYKNGYMANYISNSEDPGYKVSHIECTNCEQREKALKLKATYQLSRKVNEFDGEIYLEYAFDKDLHDLNIGHDQKELEFHQYYHVLTSSEFQIPSDWKLKFLPKSISVKTGEFEIHAKLEFKDHKLTYSKEIKILQGYVSEANIAAFMGAHKKLKEFYTNNVIFTK